MNRDHLSPDELMAALAEVERSPADGGRVVALVARPAVDERETRRAVRLSSEYGMEGDRWLEAGESAEQRYARVIEAGIVRVGDEVWKSTG